MLLLQGFVIAIPLVFVVVDVNFKVYVGVDVAVDVGADVDEDFVVDIGVDVVWLSLDSIPTVTAVLFIAIDVIMHR